MRRKWLAFESMLLALSLIISLCCSYGTVLAEESSADTVIQEAVQQVETTQPDGEQQVDETVQPDGEQPEVTATPKEIQFFVVSTVNQAYNKADANRFFERLLSDLLQLIPEDSSTQVVFFPENDAEGKVFENPVDAVEIKLPHEVKKPAACLSTIEQNYLHLAKKNVVIVLENRNPSRADNKQDWEYLKQLAAKGVEVYFIGLQTENNAEKGCKTYGSLIGAESLSDKDDTYVNRLMEVVDNLHYIWINDYENCAYLLSPLVLEVCGTPFVEMQPDENSAYTLNLFGDFTEQLTLLVGGLQPGTNFAMTDEANNPIEYVTIKDGSFYDVLKVDSKANKIVIQTSEKLPVLQWTIKYNQPEQSVLHFSNAAGDDNTFKRNQKASFFAHVLADQNIEQKNLIRIMDAHNIKCEMIEVATGNVLQTMTYDEESQVFRCDHTFAVSSESNEIAARIKLNDTLILTSEPYKVTIVNTAPVLSPDTEEVYWINDPWAEDPSSFTIPLHPQDDEGDQMTLEIVEPTVAFVAGLGNVYPSEDQNGLQITLAEKPDLGKEFTIKVAAKDNEKTGEQYEIRFSLYDLKAELAKLQTANITVTPAGSITKNEEFEVTASIDFPDTLTDALKEALQRKIQKHYQCKVEISKSDTQPESYECVGTEKRSYTGRLTQSGTYSIKAVFYTDKEDLFLETETVSLTVEGSYPTKIDNVLSESYNAMLTAPDGGSDESWSMEGLVPSELFSDDDNDEITITVNAKRIDPHTEEDILPMEEVIAVGDEPATLTFTIAGTYEVTITSKDQDGDGDTITCTIKLTSARRQLLLSIVLGAIGAVLLVVLVCATVYLVKPSFKGKAIQITIQSARWTKTSKVYADVWNKKKQPLNVLLTCAAFPPERSLYVVFEDCIIKAQKKGITLLKAERLGLEKKVRIHANEPLSFTIDQYTLKLELIEE